MKKYIFGAKSLALGVYCALSVLEPACCIDGFVVSSLENNPKLLAGRPVIAISDIRDKDAYFYIATPEDIHSQIITCLEERGFRYYRCIDSKMETDLMEQYYARQGLYPSIHSLSEGKEVPRIFVGQAMFWKDKILKRTFERPKWVFQIQVGADLTDVRVADLQDNVGDNISMRNVNYCELTALYWLWKNQLLKNDIDYYGLFHYRRILELSDDDLAKLKQNDIDVVLPFPTIHEPSVLEHHQRYIKELDWEAMLQALTEIHPEYAEIFPSILNGQYMYNYNILIAKKEIFSQYCEWLFPILARTEELSDPKGWERSDRYIGYLGENLLTIYFMANLNNLRIVHTGRIMLT